MHPRIPDEHAAMLWSLAFTNPTPASVIARWHFAAAFAADGAASPGPAPSAAHAGSTIGGALASSDVAATSAIMQCSVRMVVEPPRQGGRRSRERALSQLAQW